MTKNGVYIGVAILAVIAVILGYNIYQQTTTGTGATPSDQQSQTRTIPQPTGIEGSSSASSGDTVTIAADRKKIASYPGPSASEEQKKEFGTIIGKNAQTSDTLDITNCNTSPLVLKVKKGSNIKLINNGSTGNAILFGPGKQHEVPANGSITMTVSLDVGINSYRCTGISGSPIVGVFVVE